MAAPTLTQIPIPILIVDDQPANLVALRAILQQPEYEVVTAPSGEQALREVLQREFAVILMDVKMPDMGGFETAHLIKERPKSRNVPIIFVTAVATDVTEVYRGYSVGAVDYLLKPLDPAVVRAKVAVFADLFRANEEIKQQAEIIRYSERAESLEREQMARIRAEAAEQRYHDLINWVDHAVLWEYDAQAMRFRFVSARSAAILGFPPERWVDDPDFFMNRIPAADRVNVREMFARASRDGDGGRSEHRFHKANGDTIWVHTGVNPRRDGSGTVSVLWGLTVDITPLKQAEQNQRFLAHASVALTESLDYAKTLEALAHVVVPAMADLCAIDMLNPGGGITRKVLAVGDSNKRKIAETLQGKGPYQTDGGNPILRVIQSGEPVLVRNASESFLRSVASDEQHLAFLRELKIESVMIVPLKSHKGSLGSISFASCDPDRHFVESDLDFAQELALHATLAFENSRLYDDVQRAAQMRENVLGVVSHDLKTPLSAIRIALQMIVKRPNAGPALMAERAIESVDRMDRLIRDLLDMARMDAGQSPLELKPQEAGKILGGVVETMQPIAARNTISISPSVPADEILLRCDRDRIHRVLSNIVGNAIKFSAAGATVFVGVKAGEDAAEFWVADSGTGIFAGEMPHVFEPFWQAKGEKKGDGSGLGLFISKKIIDAHGGRIWIDSAPSKGTTVHFTVPLAEARDARQSA